MISTVIAVIATILTIVRSWPQFARAIRSGNTDGVSVLTWSLALAEHTSWLVLGIYSHLVVLIIVNVLGAAGVSMVVYRVGGITPVLPAIGCAAVIATAVGHLNQHIMVACVVTLSTVMFVPQALKVLRGEHHGVSPAAWTLNAACSASWLAWGLSIGRPFLQTAHYFALPLSVFIAVRANQLGEASRASETLTTTADNVPATS